jgi:hypothetical protein
VARRTRDDYCLLCAASPCECTKKKSVSSRPPIRKALIPPPAKPETPTSQPVRRAGLGSVRRVAPPPAPIKPVVQHRSVKIEPSAADREMAQAVTILVQAGLVSAASIEEHRRYVNLTDTEIRAILWKQRRKGGGSPCQ